MGYEGFDCSIKSPPEVACKTLKLACGRVTKFDVASHEPSITLLHQFTHCTQNDGSFWSHD